jgi:hypothetical protein
MSIPSGDDDPILDPELTGGIALPDIDRRSFIMRSAMIGAVSVLSGSVPASAKETAEKAASAPPVPPKVTLSPRPRGGEAVEGGH